MRNALTCDVEDYFQVSAFDAHVPRSSWDQCESRIERNVERVLDLLGRRDAKATFFVLGWVARRHPRLVRAIADRGHEVASHGYAHERASALTSHQFESDVRASKRLLEDVCGREVIGYRAPSFSIGATNPWSHDVLGNAGYRYSSSIYPVRHDHYGMPDGPRFPYRAGSLGALLEIPIATARLGSRNLPAGGGGYFRLLPYVVSRRLLACVNRRDRVPAVFYFHPWELDPDQPRVRGVSYRTRFRHYINLARTEPRLDRLLSDFTWGRMDDIFLGASA